MKLMTSLTLDQKYAALVEELAQQNATFKTFLNGAEDDTVYLDSNRTVKTLLGTIKDLKRFQYVQKVIDHRLYNDMIAADATIAIGLLVRVWGDVPAKVGLYRKDSAGVYTKVSYQDLYDLRDVLPDPWNYLQIKADETQTDETVALVQFQLPVAAATASSQVLRGTYQYNIQVDGYKGTIAGDVMIVVSASTQSKVSVKIQVSNRLVGDVDDGLSTVVLEKVVINRISSPDVHTFSVSFVPPSTLVDGNILGSLDFRFNGVDTKVVKKTAALLGQVVIPDEEVDLVSIYEDSKV
jgi:hypothetical protein